MSEYSAIENLPEDWSRRIRCPICSSNIIQIQRFDNRPDLVHCPDCGIRFQIEKKGQHILFVETPINFLENMRNRWLSRNDIEEAVKKIGSENKNKNLSKKPSKPVITKSNPVRAEAVRRARTLVQLKNSPEAVRTALKGSLKLRDIDIEEIILDAFNVYEEQQKQRNRMIIKYSVYVGVFLILFFIVLYLLI